jgi:hypothetical protein
VNNKVLAIALGTMAALLAVSLAVRFVLLLLRLGVFNSGQRSGGVMVPWQHTIGMQPPNVVASPPGVAVSQRLHELERLLSSGAISSTEYAAKRQQIISNM